MGKGLWDRGCGTGPTESPECAQPLEQPRVHCCTSAPLGSALPEHQECAGAEFSSGLSLIWGSRQLLFVP